MLGFVGVAAVGAAPKAKQGIRHTARMNQWKRAPGLIIMAGNGVHGGTALSVIFRGSAGGWDNPAADGYERQLLHAIGSPILRYMVYE